MRMDSGKRTPFRSDERVDYRTVERLHRRLRSILDSMHHVVVSFSFDEKADEAEVRDGAFFDRHLVEINPAAETLYGVPKEDFLAGKRSLFDFIHEGDKEEVLRHYNDLHAEGAGHVTYRVLRPDGEVRWVLDYGTVEYREKKRVRRINRIVEDITDKKRALDELKASEKKYRRIFERSKDMIYILEPDGTFIDINPAGLELLGLGGREETALRNMREFHVDPQVSDDLLNELMEKGEATRGRVGLRNERGEVIEVDLSAIARRDDSGKVVSFQGVVTNITEALRQQELESIARLAGCFADDLASPLSVVAMSLDVIGDTLAELKKILSGCPQVEQTPKLEPLPPEVHRGLGRIKEFKDEAATACTEITRRLREIREECWRLRKVPDGIGGLIYERRSRRADEGPGETDCSNPTVQPSGSRLKRCSCA